MILWCACGPQPLPGDEGNADEGNAEQTGADAGEGMTVNLDGNDGEASAASESGDEGVLDLPAPHDAALDQTCYSFASEGGPEVVWQRVEPWLGAWWGVAVDVEGNAYVSGEGGSQLAAYDASGHERWSISDRADSARAIVWSGERLVVGGTSIHSSEDHPDWLRVYSREGELLDEHLDELGDDAFWNLAGNAAGELLAGGRHWGSEATLRVALYGPDLVERWSYTTGALMSDGGSSLPEVAFDEQGRAYASFRFQPPETRSIVRFDAAGQVEWSADLGQPSLPSAAWPSALAIGELVLAGGTVQEGNQISGSNWLGGFDDAGLAVWSTTFGSHAWDAVETLALVADGVLAGGHVEGSLDDAWLAQLSAGGELMWSLSVDGVAGGDDDVHAIATAPGGELLVVGAMHCSGEQPFVARLRLP